MAGSSSSSSSASARRAAARALGPCMLRPPTTCVPGCALQSHAQAQTLGVRSSRQSQQKCRRHPMWTSKQTPRWGWGSQSSSSSSRCLHLAATASSQQQHVRCAVCRAAVLLPGMRQVLEIAEEGSGRLSIMYTAAQPPPTAAAAAGDAPHIEDPPLPTVMLVDALVLAAGGFAANKQMLQVCGVRRTARALSLKQQTPKPRRQLPAAWTTACNHTCNSHPGISGA